MHGVFDQAAPLSRLVWTFPIPSLCNSFSRFRISSPQHSLSALQYWQLDG
jgi:hypothetical protein